MRTGPTFEGVTRLSRSLNSRNDSLRSLLKSAGNVSGVLAQRSQQLNALILNANDLIGVLNDRREALVGLLNSVSALSKELSGLVADNEKELAPTLTKLNSVTAMLEQNRDNIANAIATDNSYTHSCALRTDGQVACWGQGDGSRTTTADGGIPIDLTPAFVDRDCRAISAGIYDSCALRSAGAIDCWGLYAGKTPTAISGITNAVAIASDGGRNCALLSDGTIYCFSATGAAEWRGS